MPVPGLGEEKSLRRIRYEGIGSTAGGVDYTSTPSEVDSSVESIAALAAILGAEMTIENSSAPTSLEHESTRNQGGTATSPHLNQEAPHSMDEFSEFDNNKIICTTIYNSLGSNEWYTNRILWNTHKDIYLTKYHQTGYYILFKPFTNLMRKNNFVFQVGKYMAKCRTYDIKAVMNNNTRYIPGMIIRYIFEPISFVIGYIILKVKG